MNKVLVLKAGDAANAVRSVAGDYDRWFLEALGGGAIRFEIVQVHLGQGLPARPREHDAVVMTGSSSSVTELAPWMLRAGEFMREAGEQGVPVLGVCFGHQLLAHAYSGRVEKHPRGREIGTIEVELEGAGSRDFLFEGLPSRFSVQATHVDHVPELPPGARLLARNAHCSVQAMAFGPHVRGVQFHPEMPPAGMRAIIESRAALLEAEAPALGIPSGDRVRALLAGVGPTPAGLQILRNFLAHVS